MDLNAKNLWLLVFVLLGLQRSTFFEDCFPPKLSLGEHGWALLSG